MARTRILFVDDEPNVLDGLRRMLRRSRHEWEVDFARTGAEALAKMHEKPFEVVVSDVQMPDMTGLDLLERLRRDFPATTRIILTGRADEDMAQRATDLVHQFLAKPIEPQVLKQTMARALELRRLADNKLLQAIVADSTSLPTIPAIYQEIQRIVESENSSIAEIATVVGRDLATSAKLLQLVNSSFFGLGRRVSSVEHAITLLGLVRLRALVLANHLFAEFKSTVPGELLSMDLLWHHSLRVATVAREITLLEGQGEDRPDQAFTAGMLHDVGLVLLAARQPDTLERCLENARQEGRSIWQSEMELLGATHADVGGYLLGLWGLPMRIVEAVALHHTPNSIPYDGLCATTVVHVADYLIGEAWTTPAGYHLATPAGDLDSAYLRRLGLAHRLDHWRAAAERVAPHGVEVIA